MTIPGPCKATDHTLLIDQIMDSRLAKNEREWAASKEITDLKKEGQKFEAEMNSLVDSYLKTIEGLKQQIVNMRTECNKRFSKQLLKIRKLEAEKMLQIQPQLFKDDN